ncbi:MAG: hypothetical protein Q9195_003215 [Heterodermia aff. obscurata]
MAAGDTTTPPTHPAFLPPTPAAQQNAVSPPSKRDLTSWWKNFKKNTKKEEEKANATETAPGIFGVPLQTSIKYANVAISLTNEQGESFIYGYVPIVVAKCGVFLKEKATDVEGIFRLSGSAKRIKDLQTIFDTPDRYGKGLDWTGYTVHDAANILRRYLNQLPQPIVPLDFYERARDPLRSHQAQAVGDLEAQSQDTGDFDHALAITTYQRLITELPALNRQLLLYILDLLAVFASKSDLNRMTSANLAAIFQPGLLSHPSHDMSPSEYRLSQDVLIFLIENQDSFLIGMSGTAADEKTVKEVQSGPPPRQPISPNAKNSIIGRSASNASAGADSLRKYGGIRRNVSVSSKNSKSSQNMPSPISPQPGSPHASISSGGVHRSNTVPSKRSPGIAASSRFQNPLDVSNPSTPKGSGGFLSPTARASSPSPDVTRHGHGQRPISANSSITPTAEHPQDSSPTVESTVPSRSKENILQSEKLSLQPPSPALSGSPSSGTPRQERKVSSLFTKSPTSDPERSKETRQPNKLRKKRPESSNPSAQSSTHSLHGAPESPANQVFYTPLPTPGGAHVNVDPMSQLPPFLSNTAATPSSETPTPVQELPRNLGIQEQAHHDPDKSLRPKSPAPSVHSRSSVTDFSEADQVDDTGKKHRKKHSWRSSFSPTKKTTEPRGSNAQLGSNAIAERSAASVVSATKPRKSMTNDTQMSGTDTSGPMRIQSSSNESTPSKDKDKEAVQEDHEKKKGPVGWFKAKIAQAKEERKEREAEKERTKSPSRNAASTVNAGSKQSLSAVVQDSMPTRGRSMDASRDGSDPVANGASPPSGQEGP